MIFKPKLPLLVPLVLAVLGLVLVGLSAVTPAHSDPAAFAAVMAEIDAVRSAGADGGTDFNALSRAFHAAQARYATLKWPLADLGYTALALAVLTALVGRIGWAGTLRTQRHPWIVVGLLAAALAALTLGLLAAPVHAVRRGLVPDWADALAIPIFETFFLMAVATPVLALLVLTPLLRRGQATALVVRPGPPWWPDALVSLIYLPFLAYFALAAVIVWDLGSWATAPAGLLLVWLLLNARGLWLAPREPAP
jgi:hypothetical protein